MFRVCTKKLRSQTAESAAVGAVGYLLDYPVVGRTMVLFQERDGRTVTTQIQRVLGDNGCVYVQTENSVYRVEIIEQVNFEGPAQQPRAREKAVW